MGMVEKIAGIGNHSRLLYEFNGLGKRNISPDNFYLCVSYLMEYLCGLCV
jgi:hypothetical protein